jgi:hypothetical protein
MAWPVFFARDAVAAKEPLDRAVAEPVTLRTEGAAQLLDGDVGGRVQQVLDQLALRFDPPGPAVATEWTGTRIALHPLKCTPTAHPRGADAEPRRGFPMTGACGDHRQNPGPKIKGTRLRHARRPPSPADSLNQNSPAMGIPNRCNQMGCRSSHVWNRLPEEIREQVITLALEEPELSPRELAVRFTDSQS